MNIFVAKLSAETTSEDIKELFSQFGIVASSKVIMDKETNASKRYGFIEMENDSDGYVAIEHLNETNFLGNTIVVRKSDVRGAKKTLIRKPSFNNNRNDAPNGNRRYDNERGNSY